MDCCGKLQWSAAVVVMLAKPLVVNSNFHWIVMLNFEKFVGEKFVGDMLVNKNFEVCKRLQNLVEPPYKILWAVQELTHSIHYEFY